MEIVLNYAAIRLTVDEDHHLPLQLAVQYGDLDSVKVLFDAYPETIRIFDYHPFDTDSKSTITFIRAQQEWIQIAKDTLAMHSPDMNGWLPLHHALKDAASLGSIELLLKGNPSALRVISNIGALPIHIACQFSSSKVVKHLVELDEGRTLHYNDMKKDSPLHYACRGGNLGVVKYVLSEHTSSLLSSAEVNEKGELPIHMLYEAVKDMVNIADNTEYTEIIWRMLLASPETIVVRG